MKELEIRKLIREQLEAFYEEEVYGSQFKDLSKSGEELKKNLKTDISDLKKLIDQKKREKNVVTEPKHKSWVDQEIKNAELEMKQKKEDLSSIESMSTDLTDLQKDIEVSQSETEKTTTSKVDSEITGVDLPSQT